MDKESKKEKVKDKLLYPSLLLGRYSHFLLKTCVDYEKTFNYITF